MIGRRLQPTADGKVPFDEMTQPGDYCGPIMGYTGDRPAVFFIHPVDPSSLPTPHIRLAHVCAPPHRFRECGDGSLEIRESILTTYHHWVPASTPEHPVPHEQQTQQTWQWHGYLDEGHGWRTV